MTTSGPLSGPRGYPIVGVLPHLFRDPLRFLCELEQRHPEIVFLPVGPERVYFVTDPELVKVVFSDQDKVYSKGLFFERQKIAFGEGLLTSDGELWRTQRRLVQPAFHMKRIAALTDAMALSAERSLDAWAASARAGEPLDVAEAMMEITQRIIQRTMFGDLSDAVQRSVIKAMPSVLSYLLRTAMSPVSLPVWLPTPMNRRFREAMRTIDEVVYASIEDHRRRPRDEADLVSMLLEARDEQTGAAMSDKQLRDEAVTIYIAGHETTANSLAWALFLLSAYPKVERQLAAEVREVLGGRRPTFNDIPNLRFTRMVMNEVMRLYPANWVIARTVTTRTTLGRHTLPAGAHVIVSSWAMGRSARHWPDPERFDPERFGPDAAPAHKYAAFPFGGGPRQCIGTNFAQVEQALVLASIVQRYRLELVPGHPVVPDPLVTVRPKHGLKMYVRPRTN